MRLSLLVCVFFFFKQKTAYEMRISDWSSDVCSSDLAPTGGANRRQRADDDLALAVDLHRLGLVRHTLEVDDKLVADAKHIGIAHLTCERPADRGRRPENLIAQLTERDVPQPGLIFTSDGGREIEDRKSTRMNYSHS